MDPVISDYQQQIAKTTNALKEEFKSIRTGRANPALIENIIVETYGGQSKLKLMELATITTGGPSALLISPFDPTVAADIEKAILKSPLGASPRVQGTKILLNLPPLSFEQREKLTKLISQKTEDRRNQIRNFRDNARRRIKNDLETKAITEDEKFRLEKEIDNMTQKIMEEVQAVKEKKEKEIMEM